MSELLRGKPSYSYWTIELNTVCPACDKDIDLLDYADFWDGRKLQPAEEADIDVVCPDCGAVFLQKPITS